MRPRISIRGSVHPSVHLSVGPLRLPKTPSLCIKFNNNQDINQPTTHQPPNPPTPWWLMFLTFLTADCRLTSLPPPPFWFWQRSKEKKLSLARISNNFLVLLLCYLVGSFWYLRLKLKLVRIPLSKCTEKKKEKERPHSNLFT